MMVLRHIGPPTCTIVRHEDEEDGAAPIDLSKKHVPIEVPHRHSNKSPYNSIVPSLRSAHIHSHGRNLTSVRNAEQSPHNSTRTCRTSVGLPGAPTSEVRWHEHCFVHRNDEDNNSYSSPDSGLQRDSPGEDDDQAHNSGTPPLRFRRQHHIPLSLIQARFHQREPNNNSQDDESPRGNPPDQVKTKRARLEEMVSHIKQTNPKKIRSSHGLSGDEDTSSGEQAMSSDEIADESPTDLRHEKSAGSNETILSIPENVLRVHRNDNEPFNLTFPKVRPNSPREMSQSEFCKDKTQLKNMQALSPAEAAKAFGVDPETYQQQMMQLQLTSAAMMGDPGGFLKAMGNCPPWVYLSYYQLMQNFQAQELIRQYAMQSQSAATPATISQEEKSPNIPTSNIGSSYNCRSPMSPASLSEGPNGIDSDGSVVGQSTPGSANGKRAPRAMTGRHVRTGTGASPSTLQTLREKIEERQRLKAQQAQGGTSSLESYTKGKGSSSNTSINNNNNNFVNNNHSNSKSSKKSKR